MWHAKLKGKNAKKKILKHKRKTLK
jgi:hypothetical protein